MKRFIANPSTEAILDASTGPSQGSAEAIERESFMGRTENGGSGQAVLQNSAESC
jgi:hypothetical protein